MANQDISRYLENWQSEIDNVYLYEAIAKDQKVPELAEVFHRLSKTEENHAAFWQEKLKRLGKDVDAKRGPSLRARVLRNLAKGFGSGFILSAVTVNEVKAQRSYDSQPEAKDTPMPAEEKSHARVLLAMAKVRTGGMDGGMVASLEGRHGAVRGNALRAAVLGVNDGLVSNLSLIMGVSGAMLSNHAILLTGVAGLLAGACSMAMGEWLSVQSSRELYQSQIESEAEELAEHPKEEEEELALIFQSKGIPKEEAQSMAASIMKDKAGALQTLAREELGIDPDELGGSAWEAAGASFVLFVIGAIVPLCPFFFLTGTRAQLGSLIFGAAGLFLSGMLIAFFTGRKAVSSGVRQLLIGLAAAAVTYGIGRLFGVSLGG